MYKYIYIYMNVYVKPCLNTVAVESEGSQGSFHTVKRMCTALRVHASSPTYMLPSWHVGGAGVGK